MSEKRKITDDLMALEADSSKVEVLISDLQEYLENLMEYSQLPAWCYQNTEIRISMMRDYITQMQETIKNITDKVGYGGEV